MQFNQFCNLYGHLRSSLAKFELLYLNKYHVCGYEIFCLISHYEKKSSHTPMMTDMTTPEIS